MNARTAETLVRCYRADKPVDSIFEYLSQRYPCTPATASAETNR